jgi:hypothetical protein
MRIAEREKSIEKDWRHRNADLAKAAQLKQESQEQSLKKQSFSNRKRIDNWMKLAQNEKQMNESD